MHAKSDVVPVSLKCGVYGKRLIYLRGNMGGGLEPGATQRRAGRKEAKPIHHTRNQQL